MYFSRLTVRADAASSGRFWTALRSAYSLHQAIWEVFGDHQSRKRDFLYHVKEGKGPPVVYALSARAPRRDSALWWVDEPKEFAPKLREGMRLGFLLRANPVVTKKPEAPDSNPKKRKRHDVVMEEKHKLKMAGVPRDEWPRQADVVHTAGGRWLRERSSQAGFHLHDVRADAYRQHKFHKRGGQMVRFSTVDFTGILEVRDPILFLEKLRAGFGPAKGFGCGLMLIRRV